MNQEHLQHDMNVALGGLWVISALAEHPDMPDDVWGDMYDAWGMRWSRLFHDEHDMTSQQFHTTMSAIMDMLRETVSEEQYQAFTQRKQQFLQSIDPENN